MEELERMEAEEAVKVEGASRSLDKGLFNVVYEPISIEDRYYLNF